MPTKWSCTFTRFWGYVNGLCRSDFILAKPPSVVRMWRHSSIFFYENGIARLSIQYWDTQRMRGLQRHGYHWRPDWKPTLRPIPMMQLTGNSHWCAEMIALHARRPGLVEYRRLDFTGVLKCLWIIHTDIRFPYAVYIHLSRLWTNHYRTAIQQQGPMFHHQALVDVNSISCYYKIEQSSEIINQYKKPSLFFCL